MTPFAINGRTWRMAIVGPDDPRLVDRTGDVRLATTDPMTRTVCISSEVGPPLLDRVALHEAAHVMAIEGGTLEEMRAIVPNDLWLPVEEWAAREIEVNGLAAAELASRMLGRPVCVKGICHGQP